MDIAAASPREIDEQLAELYRLEGAAEQVVAAVVEGLHYALDERALYVGRRKAWPTTDAEAIAAVRAKAAAGEKMSLRYSGRPWSEKYARYEAAAAALEEIEAKAEPLHAEYVRRGRWSRYFLAQSSNGHYHSSMGCQTCNNGASATRFGWNPQMSGWSEADAIAELDRQAAVLCSVCFPTAPVAMFTKRPDPNECPGGSAYADGLNKPRRVGSRIYGQCPSCRDNGILVTAAGRVRKHRKPKVEAK